MVVVVVAVDQAVVSVLVESFAGSPAWILECSGHVPEKAEFIRWQVPRYLIYIRPHNSSYRE